MATQAEEAKHAARVWKLTAQIWAKVAPQIWKPVTWIQKQVWRIKTHIPPIVITVKLMVTYLG